MILIEVTRPPRRRTGQQRFRGPERGPVKRALAVLAASTIAAGALTGCTPGTDHDRAACEILGAQIREAPRVTPAQYFDQISGALEHSEDMDEVLVRRLLGSLYAAGGPSWAVSVNDAPACSVTFLSTKVPIRISGPLVSNMMATGALTATAASRTCRILRP